jgi:hypothetical protein
VAVDVIELLEQPCFFMGEVTNLVLVCTGKFEDLLLLFIEIFGEAVDHSFFHADDFIESFALGFESIGYIFELLIFYESLTNSLILNFF